MSKRGGIGSLLARAAGATLAVKVLAAGLTYLLHLLLARVMGSTGYGDYAYALAWIGLLSLFCTAGLDTGALRFVASYASTERWGAVRGFLRRAGQVVAAVSLVIVALYVAGVYYLSEGLRVELVAVLALAAPLLPISAFIRFSGRILQAMKHVVLAEAPNVVLRPIVLGGAVLLVAAAEPGPPSAATVIVLNVLVALGVLALLVVLTRLRLPVKVREASPVYHTREWMVVGLPLLLLGGLHVLIARTDVLMVGAFLETTDAGIYAIGARTAELTGFGLLAVNAIAAPLIAEQHSRGETANLQRTVTLAARGSTVFALLVAGVLFAAGAFVLGLFGAEFRAAYVPMLVLVTGQVASAFVGSVGYLMTMTGHERVMTLVVGGAAALNVLLNFLLIPRYGLLGASIATATSLALWNFVLALLVRRRLSVAPTALGSIWKAD